MDNECITHPQLLYIWSLCISVVSIFVTSTITQHDITEEVMYVCENMTFFESESYSRSGCRMVDYRDEFRLLSITGVFLAFLTECIVGFMVCGNMRSVKFHYAHYFIIIALVIIDYLMGCAIIVLTTGSNQITITLAGGLIGYNIMILPIACALLCIVIRGDVRVGSAA